MPYDNEHVANILDELASMLEMSGNKGDRFKVSAYKKGALAVRQLTRDINTIDFNTEKIPGIGKSMIEKIGEILQTGTCKKREELIKDSPVPPTVTQFKKLPGIGPKKAIAIWEKYKVATLEELDAKIKDGTIDNPDLAEALEFAKRAGSRRLYRDGFKIAEKVRLKMLEMPGVKIATHLGSIRRKKPTVKDADIGIVVESPEIEKKVVEEFLSMAQKVRSSGPQKPSIYINDFQVDLTIIPEDEYGTYILHATGSAEFNIAMRMRALSTLSKMSLSEHGITNSVTGEEYKFKTEEAVFKFLRLQYIPPEMRENQGEIELAEKHEIPEFVTMDDIETDYHLHSKYSDGSGTIEQLAEEAKRRGLKTIVITDHAKKLAMAGGLKDEELQKQIDHIKSLNIEGIAVKSGIELNIDSSGNIDDYPEEILKQLDEVIASVHFGFNGDQTERLIKAIQNPYVTILGHPDCADHGKREPIKAGWEKVIKVCAENNVALEITGQPSRYGLSIEMCKIGKKYGVKFTLGTDTHRLENMDYMQYAVNSARRGGLTKDNIRGTGKRTVTKKEIDVTNIEIIPLK
jgi:DNA polymerase (family 10)